MLFIVRSDEDGGLIFAPYLLLDEKGEILARVGIRNDARLETVFTQAVVGRGFEGLGIYEALDRIRVMALGEAE